MEVRLGGDFDTTFETEVYNKIKDSFSFLCDNLNYVCGSGSLFEGACVSLSSQLVDTYPVIKLSIPINGTLSKLLIIPPSSYMRLNNDNSCIRLAFRNATTTQLGSSFWRSYNVHFARYNSTLGLAPANQSKCGAWMTGTNLSQGEWFLNLVILGSIFGFMLFTLAIYFVVSYFKEKRPGYVRV